MKLRNIAAFAVAPLAVLGILSSTVPALGAATEPAVSQPLGHVVTMAHRTAPPLNHQFCLSEGRHLCMALLHSGINSRMVLRVNGQTRSQAIVFASGRLLLKAHPGWCVGSDPHSVEPRAAHCNGGHGVRWRKKVFPFRGIGFDNVAADRAFPGPDEHYLAAVAQSPGAALVIASNLHLPHVWRDCAGHCTRPALAHLTRVRRHSQICLQDGRHLCMFALHRGINSRIVLRPDRDVPNEDISLSFSQLRVFGFSNVCIGPNARTKRCSTPGTGWQEVTAHDSTSKFWNVADTLSDPHHRAHWLIAQTDEAGFPVTVSTQYWWPHKWFTCFGHCTRPAHATLTSFQPRADRALGCAVTVKMRQLVLSGNAVKQTYGRTDCTTKPDSFHVRQLLQQRTAGRWSTRASTRPNSKSPYPHRYYWRNWACSPGTWRAVLKVSGSNSHGVALTSPVSFYSRPLTIRNCVAGGTAAQPVQVVLA